MKIRSLPWGLCLMVAIVSASVEHIKCSILNDLYNDIYDTLIQNEEERILIFPPAKLIITDQSPSRVDLKLGPNLLAEISSYNPDAYSSTMRFCNRMTNASVPWKRRERNVRKQNSNSSSTILTVGLLRIFVKEDLSSFSYIQTKLSSLLPFQKHSFYRLDVDRQGATTIVSQSLEGLNHALTTFSQILSSRIPFALPLVVEDWPETSWRGMLIDVSRHFIPIDLLKRSIDALEASKMNVMHLHLTDSQSFPVQLHDIEYLEEGQTAPSILKLSELSQKGAFCADKVYSQADLRELVSYATSRGIEIVPEIDMPAHALSWGAAFKEVIVNCSVASSAAETPHNIYPLDPTSTLTMRVVEGILAQIARIFPSLYLHVGGDEVNIHCWQESAAVVEWATARGLDMRGLLEDFEKRVFAIVRNLGKIPIIWQGVQDAHALPLESLATADVSGQGPISRLAESRASVVQPWKCWGGLAARAGSIAAGNEHPVVMAACWYLDFEQDWTHFLATNMISEAIKQLERHRPHRHLRNTTSTLKAFSRRNLAEFSSSANITRRHSDYFIGGEGAMWTEKVDHSNFECRMWPRGGAIATRLWGLGPWAVPQASNESAADQGLLSVQQSRHLLMSFVHYREHLASIVGISPSVITFHYNRGSSALLPGARVEPISVRSEEDAMSRISMSGSRLSLRRGQSGYPSPGEFFSSAHCLGIPECIQRPVKSPRFSCYRLHCTQPVISLFQLNVADGSTGMRGSSMLQWLQQKVNTGIFAVGFCELNGWQELQKASDSIMSNFPVMALRAANAGFSFSHVMVNKQPYNIGVVASVKFEVIGEFGPPTFQRGVLHVYFPGEDLHLLIAHLHAHSSQAREVEATYITEKIMNPIKDSEPDAKIVLMGDLNSLSRWDSRHHLDSHLLDLLNRRDHQVFSRFRKKYLTADQSEINYKPLDILMNGGLRDSCVEACAAMTNHTSHPSAMEAQQSSAHSSSFWSSLSSDEFSQCMDSFCRGTEPTQFNPEWPKLQDNLPHPVIRLDFILVSESIVRQSRQASGLLTDTAVDTAADFCYSDVDAAHNSKQLYSSNQGKTMADPLFPVPPKATPPRWLLPRPHMYAGLENSSVTSKISDHFPIYASWLAANGNPVFMY